MLGKLSVTCPLCDVDCAMTRGRGYPRATRARPRLTRRAAQRTLGRMDEEPERPTTIEFWVICLRCGRIDLDPADFNFSRGADVTSDECHVAFDCPGCGDLSQLYMRRVLKRLQ